MKAKIINADNLPKVDQKNKSTQLKKVIGSSNQGLEQVDASQLIGYIHDYLTTRRCIISVDDMFKRSIHFLGKYKQQKYLSMSVQSPFKAFPLKKTESTPDESDIFKENKSMIQNTTEFRSHIIQKKKLFHINFQKPNSKNSTGLLSDNQDSELNRQLLKQTKQPQNQERQIKRVPTIEIIRKLKNIITQKDTKIAQLNEQLRQLNIHLENFKKIVDANQSKLNDQNDQLQQLSKQLSEKQNFKILTEGHMQQQNFSILIEYPINIKQQGIKLKDSYQFSQQTSQLYIDNNLLQQQIQRLQNEQQYLWMYFNKKTAQNDFF